MHAKGINQIMIDMARKTGMPVKVSPKYAAEHMGLSYHQAESARRRFPRRRRRIGRLQRLQWELAFYPLQLCRSLSAEQRL